MMLPALSIAPPSSLFAIPASECSDPVLFSRRVYGPRAPGRADRPLRAPVDVVRDPLPLDRPLFARKEERRLIPGDFERDFLFPREHGGNVVVRPPELRPSYVAAGEAIGSVDSDEPVDAKPEVDFSGSGSGVSGSSSNP